ncbi:ImmA/IrrE family metallo-endopeptidase [Deinococcus ruber]|uniref:Uncharacterized protein n=1 Tax=Deinococcus ruber TaxID=1848197 RepID=A0A918CMV6_9DEIO|nr:hypothetical protein [Deinococcus ruber]GGR31157.1 hypothetical protein GCM10008957_47250 [Deinococcus ruber]
MSFDPDRIGPDFIAYIKRIQTHANYEAHAFRLAKTLQMRVRVGLLNRAYPSNTSQSVIVLQPWYYGWSSEVLFHEIAHVLVFWSGLETNIIKEFGPDAGWKIIEKLCNQAIAFLRIPQPVVDAAVKKHGITARTIIELMRQTNVTYQMAMDRLVLDKPADARAAFLINNGKYVSGVSICNMRLPFWIGSRVPEPRIVLPRASLFRLPHGLGILGLERGGHIDDWYWEPA